MTDYEYGIMQRSFSGLHRGPWTKEKAEEWVATWEADLMNGEKPAWIGEFYIVRRLVGEWERVDA